MKLLFCPHCQDVLKLQFERRECRCGESWGLYENERDARIGGSAVPLGFANRSLVDALEVRPETGEGSRFLAFVIPKEAPSVIDEGDGSTKQFRGAQARERELVELLMHMEERLVPQPAPAKPRAARKRKVAPANLGPKI